MRREVAGWLFVGLGSSLRNHARRSWLPAVYLAVVAAAVLVAMPGIASATTFTWTGAANNLWNTGDNNWGGLYSDGNGVVFQDGAANTSISIPSAVAPSSVLFTNNSTPYTFTGVAIGIIRFGSQVSSPWRHRTEKRNRLRPFAVRPKEPLRRRTLGA
jgi:hypothetical protein